MNIKETRDSNIATVAWSALLVWWGLALAIDPITIGMTGVGTGMILLGANAARSFSGVPLRRSTSEIGAVALLWGALDHIFALSVGGSLAVLLITIGAVQAFRLVIDSLAPRRANG
jgi:hypothetical protein